MLTKSPKYNLLEEQWIPVLFADGESARVGIKTALTQAGKIRQIAASNPMDRIAILRFLLAILYWCKGNPTESLKNDFIGLFPEEWFSKLDEHVECFNLFGDGKRFYQYTKPGNDKKRSANYLRQEVPTGTNISHFRHSADTLDGLCPACCAMGLLRLPIFATSAGAGYSPGINAKPPMYVIPQGRNLAETLWLSWLPVDMNHGTPAWEDPSQKLPNEGQVLLLLGLTWLPRRVWLDNPEPPENPCVSCSSIEPLVRLSVFTFTGSSRSEGRIWQDPHVIYDTRKSEVKSVHARDALTAPDAASGQWANIVARMIQDQQVSARLKLSTLETFKFLVVGFATVQNDKYLEAKEYLIPFLCSQEQLNETFERLELWQKESYKTYKKDKSFASIRPHVEHRVSTDFKKLLNDPETAWEQAAFEYQPMIKMVAKSLSPGITTSAVSRRNRISRIAPSLKTEDELLQANTDKQGGEK